MTADVIIVGGGIAGLYTALHVDKRLKVLLVSKETIEITNSWLAQGGIAAAISKDDTTQEHFADTLEAGAGLCDEAAVRVLVDEGPRDIEELVRMRVPFDLNAYGDLAITREGGHHRNRIVHAGGDATGRETVKVLAAIASTRGNIEFLDKSFFLDLIIADSRCAGVLVCRDGEPISIFAGSTVLCAGGIGQIYTRTTNPEVATGDGIAACSRAGVKLNGMEFIQFHPTALYAPSHTGRAFLISEAVRGEGGLLVNSKGERFMEGKHPLAELAPRDIVARGIVSELQRSGEGCVYLDITSRPGEFLRSRFPTIYGQCLKLGIDIAKDRIPVSPCQHYMVGGISAGLHSQTSLNCLYAVGETASTGVHGANRLASNSMLECLVFGRRAAEHINSVGAAPVQAGVVPLPGSLDDCDMSEIKSRIRLVCDACAGVVRTRAGLEAGLSEIGAVNAELSILKGGGRELWEAKNMARTALEVFKSALARGESVGAHYRVD